MDITLVQSNGQQALAGVGGAAYVVSKGVDNSGNSRAMLTDAAGRQITVLVPPLVIRSNVGALAASAAAAYDVDLGADWPYTLLLCHKDGAASAGESLSTYWSDDAVTWRLHSPGAAGSTANAYNNTSATNTNIQARSVGRYFRLRYVNGSTPQTSLLLAVTALAGV